MIKKIKLRDFIDVLTDYHSGGSYKILKANTKILYEPSYAVMIRTLNFERNDFENDLIYCDKDSYDFLNYSHVKENDVLMNKIANPGSVYLMPKVEYRATCGMNLFLLRFKNINQKYMYYVMKLNEDYIKSQTHGTTTKTITKDEVRNLEFTINDDLTYQERIVSLLDTIENQIYRNNDMVHKLQVLALRAFDYYSTLDRESNSVILKDIIVERDKSKIQVNDVQESSGNFPFFTSGETILYTDKQLTNGFNIYLSTGGNAKVQSYYGEAAYSTDTWCITAKDNLQFYLYGYLKHIEAQMDKLYFHGTGLKHLQKPIFLKSKIYIPKCTSLEKYNKIVAQFYRQISEIQKVNFRLQALKSKLLPLLINEQIV